MPFRTVLLALATILGLLSAGHAQPAVVLGEDSGLSFRFGGALQYNDNIFLDSADTESDTIMVFSPGVELNMGNPGTNRNLNLVYIHDILTYGDNSRLNRDNADVSLSGFHQSAKSRFDYTATYKENSQNDASNNLAGDLAQRNITSIRLGNEWNMTAKSSVAFGYRMEDVKYENSLLYDREHSSIPLNYYWRVTPKLDMSVGYRYRTTSFERSGVVAGGGGPRPDLDDQFFNVGVRGTIGAKTTGEIRVGIQERDFNTPGVKDEDLLSVDAQVTWESTEKTDFSLLLSRDFNADAFGTSIESTDIQLAGTTAISETFNGFASVRFSDDDYNGGRSDDGLFGQIGVSYTPNAYSVFSVAYILYNNDSSFVPADFDNNVFNISGTLRY